MFHPIYPAHNPVHILNFREGVKNFKIYFRDLPMDIIKIRKDFELEVELKE